MTNLKLPPAPRENQPATLPCGELGYNRSLNGSYDKCPARPAVKPQIHLPRGGGGPGTAAHRLPRLRLLVLSRGACRAAAGGWDHSSLGFDQSRHRDLRLTWRPAYHGLQP